MYMEEKVGPDGILMWEYGDHTKMKHLAFKDYFTVWAKIMSSWNNINYVDCFGGCGKYFGKDGKIFYGSPVLATEIISDCGLASKAGLVVIEKKKKYAENLDKIFRDLNLNPAPKIINKEFEEVINKDLWNIKGNTAPTFFFVDPFGLNVKMSTLKFMMETKNSEVLLNFMYDGVVRNLEVEQAKDVLTNLYGSTEWENCQGEKEIVHCFRNKLKEIAKFVVAYRLAFPDKDRTYYYLFHLSNHVKGASIMKDCFAKYNHGRTEYLGKVNDQLTLFDVKGIKIKDVQEFLLKKYKNKKKRYFNIIEELIDTEPYLEKEIYQSLKELEGDAKIVIERYPPTTQMGKSRMSLQNGDEVIFS